MPYSEVGIADLIEAGLTTLEHIKSKVGFSNITPKFIETVEEILRKRKENGKKSIRLS
jgi:hypothetical protein